MNQKKRRRTPVKFKPPVHLQGHELAGLFFGQKPETPVSEANRQNGSQSVGELVSGRH